MNESFLTVEDVNSIIRSYGMNGVLHEIDTSKISDTYDFDDIQYDFVKVSRSTNGSDYTYTFEVVNSNWIGSYYFKQVDGTYINANASYSNGKITFTTSYDSVILVLYCTNLHGWETFKRWNRLLQNMSITNNTTLDKIDRWEYIPTVNLVTGDIVNTQIHFKKGVFDWGYTDLHFFFLGKLIKTDFQFNITDSLVIGKTNTVQLGTNSKYKPNGALIGANTPIITVDYNGETIPVTYDDDLNDYTFDLDLTDKTTTGKIHFNVNVENNDVINATSTKVTLDTQYTQISTVSDFTTECSTNGASTIELTADLTLTNDITVDHSIKIIGNEHTIDLNGYSIKLKEGTITNIESVNFYNGDTTLKQAKNTELTLKDCSFTNCTSTNYNNLGSCIYCDVDEDSLTNPNDFLTDIENCYFKNNMNCIFHGGQLNINNSKYHNFDLTYIDKHNTAFLYQTDGTANITNSIFDIDYTDETLCTNEESIGYAQALIQIGTNANINGANAETLRQDNTLPFDTNATHIFAKYYYPQIETCVYTSPTISHEDKNLCYTVTGTNWIYKQNTQITRASWDTQNETRKIVWED